MDTTTVGIFVLVYLGMILGEWPGLAVDRTGVALLGAIALMALGRVSTAELWRAVDMRTLVLLFALMILSAQFRLSGFYSWTVRRLAAMRARPSALLAAIIAVAGLLSTVLANDIVCLAMAPVLVQSCAKRRLDPKPFLLALACAANVGSAATLIGNPQNMLIGQVLRLPFGGYVFEAAPPAVAGLVATWLVITALSRGRWQAETEIVPLHAPEFDRWQTAKGMAVLGAIVVLFLAASWPREIVALAAAGILLCSQKMHSREMLGLVDWQLLVLFIGLFIVNHAMQTSGNLAAIMSRLESSGVELGRPEWLFGATVVLSNLVSNVPAVMLLLPAADHPQAGAILALASTLAGNLVVVGSIANIIVIEQAKRLGVSISWGEHARLGIPVTLATLVLAALWLWII